MTTYLSTALNQINSPVKYLLLSIIRIYWLIPNHWKSTCLFRNSCSRHVYDVCKKEGLVAGIRAFFKRTKQCRSGYKMIHAADGTEWVLLADHTLIERKEMRI
jgi:putative component of membrane protein insertase Oxa1/YidC/SpoIIIJ protein YidD